MATHYRTKGIFLRKADSREADQLFTVYAEDFGKIKVSGKAIRKITSKLRGGAELFYLSEIEFIQGKTHKTLTDAILIDKFFNIRQDLRRLRIAYKIADILDELVVKEEIDQEIWQLLQEIFDRLNNWKLPAQGWSASGGEIIYYYFFWNLVSILGYQPDISGCFLQGKKINCDIIKILKVILKKDWQILSKLKIELVHLKLLENISRWYNDNIVRPNE